MAEREFSILEWATLYFATSPENREMEKNFVRGGDRMGWGWGIEGAMRLCCSPTSAPYSRTS